MPLYEYQCDKCGTVFEKMQKFADEPVKTHEACGGPVHRLLSAPALQFKGTGWYITDYARSGSSGGAKNDSKGDSKGDSNGGSKSSSETKSDSSAKSSESSSTSSKKLD